MEDHPLLRELLQICSAENVNESQAHLTFQSYVELSEVQMMHELEYNFNKTLKMFYLTGKREKLQEPQIFVPVLIDDDLSTLDINNLFENLNPLHKKLNLLIRDRNSSSTCYEITNGLVKPDSPFVTKEKKSKEFEKYLLEKSIEKNKKKIYMKAIKNS